MEKRLNYAAAFLLLLVMASLALVGCTTRSNPPGDRPAVNDVTIERIATSYTVNAQVRSTTAKILKAKLISVEDAKQVLQMTDLARAAIDSAKDFYFAGRMQDSNRLLNDAEKLHLDAQQQRNRAESLNKEPKPQGGK